MADRDFYTSLNVLPDQAGADGVLTFDFPESVHMCFVRAIGAAETPARASISSVPSSSSGIPIFDEPTPVMAVTKRLYVWAPTGTNIAVWGYSY